MTVTDTDPDATVTGVDTMPTVPAPWTRRAGALAVDTAPGAAVSVTVALVALSVPLHSAWWWICVSIGAAAILVTAFNRVLLPGVLGESLGRRVFGIAVVRRDGETAEPGRLLMRDLAHLADTAPLLVGWLWPIWDRRRGTFADILAGTESRVAEPRPARRDCRRLTAAVVLTAATLCVIVATISYGVVYQHDHATSSTSAQIAAKGPRMVEEILSYRAESVTENFDRARSLVTDNYAAQLSGQQQAVQKAGLVRNEYWVTNSSVLIATPERATMLLFLQGERGSPPDQRYLTASVRATFVDTGRAGWLVDDITVVTAPQPVEAGR